MNNKNMKKVILIVAISVVVLVIVGTKMKGKGFTSLFSKNPDIGQEAAKNKALDFIKNNLVQPGTDVSVKGVIEEAGMYKVSINVANQDIDTYLTKDGKKFFPQAMDIAQAEQKKEGSAQQAQQPAKEIPKKDMPEVKLFVMSYCPFGTQIEKGILPVVDTLGNKIKFTLEFVSYAMHDKKELDENLRQYCIQKNSPAKFNDYLACFLKKGQGTEAGCLVSAGIVEAQITGCVDVADKQFKVSENYNDKSTWSNGTYPPFDVNKEDNVKYGVQGSPTLVINDTVSPAAGRDSASLLKTICASFTTQPDECQKQLSSAAPSSGFGEGSGSNSDSSCGS
jgi:hypothetical protein